MSFNGCGNDEMYEPSELDEDDDDYCENCMWASDMLGACIMDPENGCNLTLNP